MKTHLKSNPKGVKCTNEILLIHTNSQLIHQIVKYLRIIDSVGLAQRQQLNSPLNLQSEYISVYWKTN